jgi:hypothetical protein
MTTDPMVLIVAMAAAILCIHIHSCWRDKKLRDRVEILESLLSKENKDG